MNRDIINGAREKCVLPPMDGYPHYEGKIKWMKDMWRSDRCYADYGVDGSTCSFFIYLSENRKIYLDIIHTYMEVHATVYGSSTKNISSYVKNHGILSGRDLQFLLRETKLFVGLGFPYEGPAPLEAIANGCAFLNPKFNPPKSSKNTDFFIGKPTLRELTSQHPYAEVFISRPHVWTVNLNNQEEVEDAVKAILNQKIEPYMPYEFTCEGMLQQINAFIEKQTVFLVSSSKVPGAPTLLCRSELSRPVARDPRRVAAEVDEEAGSSRCSFKANSHCQTSQPCPALPWSKPGLGHLFIWGCLVCFSNEVGLKAAQGGGSSSQEEPKDGDKCSWCT
ncbi:alpha-1,6-mannosylglycoprotein 6-beta-N-acetylglucosaminyltransferase A-like [Callospermophilus lateralis]|uniref:alpha-1,6-mannosylglycoprotein 6-beta-N-acetylglucosaminyltransferase A-like n=1 Tax=Callospermophilus lateralis TaxID=76772 RepID=UPI0040548970